MWDGCFFTPGVCSGEELCPSPDTRAFNNNTDGKNKIPQEKSTSKTFAGAKVHPFGEGAVDYFVLICLLPVVLR